MPLEHRSIFSYSVSRPYPVKWVTPTVIVGFIAFATLFSFLHLASNGFDMVIKVSPNPNITLRDSVVFKNWPTYLTDRIQPTCEPLDLHINTQYFTNKTALIYTLAAVWQDSPSHDATERNNLPSLTYLNNVLENCTISSVAINLEAIDRTASQIAYSKWGANTRTYITCQIAADSGAVSLDLIMEYD